jgi:pilus assembly protein CpaE
MRRTGAQRTDSDRGQASIELLGALPAVLLAALVAWQLVLAGHAAWLAGNAARVGARAQAVGRDPQAAARSALPAHLRRGMRVSATGGDRVTVHVRVPVVSRAWSSPLRIGAGAGLPGR